MNYIIKHQTFDKGDHTMVMWYKEPLNEYQTTMNRLSKLCHVRLKQSK